jgi:hypothetical protein
VFVGRTEGNTTAICRDSVYLWQTGMSASEFKIDRNSRYSRRTIKGGIGYNLPQEAPEAFAEAIITAAADI